MRKSFATPKGAEFPALVLVTAVLAAGAEFVLIYLEFILTSTRPCPIVPVISLHEYPKIPKALRAES